MQLKRLMATFVVLATAAVGFAQAGFKPAWAQTKPLLSDTIQGAWIITEIGGEQVLPGDQPLMIKFIMTEYTICRGEDTVESGEFHLGQKDKSILIDFLIHHGRNAGQVQLGLLKRNDDELVWAICEAGSKYRPASFYNIPAANPNPGQTLIKARWAGTRADAAGSAAASAAPQLQGRWKITSIDGKVPSENFSNDYIEFAGDRFNWSYKKGGFGGSIRINAQGSPMQIELASTDAARDGIYKGIYMVGDKELRLHLRMVDEKSADFPKDFSDTDCIAYLLVRTEAAGRLINKPEPGSHRTTAATVAAVPPPQPGRSSAAPRPAASPLDLQGNWVVGSLGGRTPPRRMAFVFTGDRFKLDDGGMVMFAGHWNVDADKTPAEINLQTEDGQGNASGVWRGLIEQQGSSLRLCLPDPDKPASPRPTTFATSTNGETVVILASRGAEPASRSLKLQGTWDVVLEGSDAPSAPASFSFDGDRFRMERGGTVMFIGHWQADAARRPATIDLQLEDARGNADQRWLGLLELTEDSLMLCLPRPGDPRPAEFKDSPPNSDGPGILTLQKR
jgi:uncharacterized protein (TIGR03067 family)